MTVEELIAHLQALPLDQRQLAVQVEGCDCSGEAIGTAVDDFSGDLVILRSGGDSNDGTRDVSDARYAPGFKPPRVPTPEELAEMERQWRERREREQTEQDALAELSADNLPCPRCEHPTRSRHDDDGCLICDCGLPTTEFDKIYQRTRKVEEL